MHGNRAGKTWRQSTDAADEAQWHAANFVICPLGLTAPWQQSVYQAAFERAVAQIRRSNLIRIRRPVLN